MRLLPALLGLVAVFALVAPGAVALRAGDGNVDAVLKKLKTMDEGIDPLLEQKGPLKGAAIDKKIDEFKALLRDALKSFPDVWGIPFPTVYDKLQEIDEMLSNKPPLVGMAWRAAKELEEELRDNGKEVPKKASQAVYELKVALKTLLDDKLEGEELVKRARELKAKKKTLLLYDFPKLFEHVFWRFFEPLEGIQEALEQAGMLSTTAGDRRKLLMRARKLKETVISMLEVQPCPKPKEAKRTIAGAAACPPVLSSITVTFVRPVTTYRITAHDRDSKRLTYHWRKQGSPCGVFSQSGPTATWSHPDGPEGNCPDEPIHAAVVAVVVSDGVFTCRAAWPYGSASTEQATALGKAIPKPGPCTRNK